jgi:tetratricopeptide (TPR) repeat protein
MRKYFYFVLILITISACKTTEKTKSSNTSSGTSSNTKMTDVQKAEITNLFFNATKEKILGNLENAASTYSEVIRRDPSNAASMYELSNIYADQKKYSDALFFSKRAYQIDRKNAWYALSYADILQKNKRFNDAADVLGRLVTDYPDHSDYYFEWASALIYADRPADAIKAYDKLETIIGVSREVSMQKARIYQRINKNDKAVEELKKLIANDPKDAQSYGMLAEVYQSMGEKEKALDTYNKILEIDPENPYIHLSLADYYRNEGQKEKSIEELKKAFLNKELDIDTKISILSSYYALISIHPELIEQALQMCDLLIQSHPSEPRAHAVYGDFLLQDKKFEEARKEYAISRDLGSKEFVVIRQILGLDSRLQLYDSLLKDSQDAMESFPDQPLVYLWNGVALSQKKEYAKAVESLNMGVKMVVDDKDLESSFYSSLGEAYNELKNFAKSDESFDKALSIDPKNANTLNNYAYFLSVRNEKIEKAEKMSKESNELEPLQASYQDTYGWIMYKMNKFDDAKLWIEKSLSNSTDSSGTVLEHYGDVLFKLGDTAKAFDYWQKAKAAGDGSEFLERKILEKKLFE